MRNQIVERQLIADAEFQRELAIERLRLDSQQRRRHRHHRDRRALGGEPPQADGALFEDLGVGREVLERQDVQRRQKLRRVAVFGRNHREECRDGFGKSFRLLVAIYYKYQRPVDRLAQQDRINGLRGRGQAGKGCASTARNPPDRVLERSMAPQIQKQISNRGMNQGRLKILSTIFVVEYPASSGIVTTRPPDASTSSRPATKCDQSAPLTRTSGRRAAINSRGVSSSNRVTASTASKASARSTRSRSPIRGREGPLIAWTQASELSASTRMSPKLRACSSSRMWPGCRRS